MRRKMKSLLEDPADLALPFTLSENPSFFAGFPLAKCQRQSCVSIPAPQPRIASFGCPAPATAPVPLTMMMTMTPPNRLSHNKSSNKKHK
ncbi:hypothetical protein M5D96_003568 [Drosophila gunungcola]|uniref:Uncharacterized protein n=1 Tax=Drosophila gunungcola TaxID=103775 RepID=A0A9P9YSG7_9MUSC|nr:hypothetical protein M5D96_003568 [Drosophila gunungcola]